jgi:hypothetical protein
VTKNVSGQSVDGIRVKPNLEPIPSLHEDQFSEANEEQFLAPFTFIAVNGEVTVSNVFILEYELVVMFSSVVDEALSNSQKDSALSLHICYFIM